MKFACLWWEDTASSHLTWHPLSFPGLFQQGCYSASWFPACTDHVISPYHKQNFILLVGPKDPTQDLPFGVSIAAPYFASSRSKERMYSVFHLPPATRYWACHYPFEPDKHATFKFNIPVIRTHFLSFQTRILQDSVKSLPGPPHPYCFLQWNGWLSNQTGWEQIVLSKPTFADLDYLLGLHVLRSRLWEAMSSSSQDKVWAAQPVTPWIHFLTLKRHVTSASSPTSYQWPFSTTVCHRWWTPASLSLPALSTPLRESYCMEWKAFSFKCSWTYIAPLVLAGPLLPQLSWYAQSWCQALPMKTKGKVFHLTASHPPIGCPSHSTPV